VRDTVEKRRAYLVRLVNRCRELQSDSGDPLLHAAEMSLYWHDELIRAARVGAVRHEWVKASDRFGPKDTRRA
jgi:hypothetical protein